MKLKLQAELFRRYRDAEHAAGRDASVATSLDDYERRCSMVLGVLASRAE